MPRATSAPTCLALVLLLGCYSKLVAADGTKPPFALPPPERPFASAGVALSEASITPRSAFFTAEDVAARFAARLASEGVFAPVAFPYPAPGSAEPDVVLGVTVRLEEKYYDAQNLAKAALHGLTFLLTLPVLPFRVGYVVDLSVSAFDDRLEPAARYAARREYDLVYAWLEMPRDAEDAWLLTTADHAIEEVVNQIKRDYAARSFQTVSAGRRGARSGW